MITCINTNNQPADIREVTGAYLNHSRPSLEDLIAMGRRIYEPSAQPGIIASHWEDDGRTMRQVVDSALTAEELAAEQAAAQEAAAEARLATFAPLVQVASLYRATLRKHFGESAEINHDVTKSSVSAYFESKRMAQTITAVETADALALSMYFDILAAWNGTGETWSLPWGIVP